ncbi:hypothetical protein [Roseovarius sp. Pro17]|uniref:hypothetical protein n=1 Tax=Roseovarius sp. Pro17 TaxID=3108175 RepID=UPI002D798BB2|nr:hypothetical protein [Roseovarius sp. Pro17]
MQNQNDTPIIEKAASSFVSEATLAHHWDISCRTLQRWRSLREGPAFSIIGGSVRYRIQDIFDYENRHRNNAAGQQ